jgi:surface polysaccharide O-acyltransferase-like enzyme
MRSSESNDAADLLEVRDDVDARRGATEPVSTIAKPRQQSVERLANVERLRIIAMLEIVTFHVGGAIEAKGYRLPFVGGLGLPVFLLLNNIFNTTLAERMGTRAFLDVKVTRLVMPWLIWCGAYGAMVLGEKVRHHEPLASAFSPWMLVGGTYEHLWFVPFALFGSLFIAGVQGRTRRVQHQLMVGVMLATGAAIVLIGAWISRSAVVEWPAAQWLFALPSPVLGFALGRVVLARDRLLLQRLAALFTLLAVLLAVVMTMDGVSEVARRYVISMALVIVFFLWPGTADTFSRRLTPLLFGVYLTHPLLVRIYQGLHLPELPTAVLGAVIFAASALLVEGLRHSPLRRLV